MILLELGLWELYDLAVDIIVRATIYLCAGLAFEAYGIAKEDGQA